MLIRNHLDFYSCDWFESERRFYEQKEVVRDSVGCADTISSSAVKKVEEKKPEKYGSLKEFARRYRALRGNCTDECQGFVLDI